MRRSVFVLTILLAGTTAAAAQTVSRSYSYFSIGGRTLEEIDSELSKRGPQVQSTGQRHPGATRMKFSTKLTHASTDRWCAVDKVSVSVTARIILPRWVQRRRADGDTRLIWDTLSADIKRHEEFHVQIAKRHARELEQRLRRIDRRRDCAALKEKVDRVTAYVMQKHDEAQERFDRVEGKTFEDRMMRLLTYRLQQMEKRRRSK
ncbi:MULTISPECIES: DUF922 domain-containing Zn-dependent protease [Nitratireductor]|uniref:DUF922 domain-containing Zn-dependent protease n=1 Tax=Nitratireductor TaxID=245876 RepID=UPI000D0DDF77|nr:MULTISPECIES: DUF922 domain-containing protein [Nitratireductor]PSM19649.1 peptidase [Nitratireductor sp. StC3]